LDSQLDVIINNNDLVIGESDGQHQELILILQKGELKESPLSTVGISSYLKESEIDAMLYDVRVCFAGDGMNVRKLSYSEEDTNLDYEADYKK